jgi:hypothetical protein
MEHGNNDRYVMAQCFKIVKFLYYIFVMQNSRARCVRIQNTDVNSTIHNNTLVGSYNLSADNQGKPISNSVHCVTCLTNVCATMSLYLKYMTINANGYKKLTRKHIWKTVLPQIRLHLFAVILLRR